MAAPAEFSFYRRNKKLIQEPQITNSNDMRLTTLYVTATNLIARGGHLILFVSIGNRYGIDITTDSVFFLYAPLIVIISVSTGVADTIVMPAMHRAILLDNSIGVRRALQRQLLRLVVPVSVVSLLLVWVVHQDTSIAMVMLLLPIPVCGSLAAFFAGLLNADGRHVEATLGPLYGCIFSLPFVFILPKTAHSLAAVLLLFELAKASGLAINARNRDRVLKDLCGDTRDLISWAIKNGKWQIIGSFLVALNPLIDILFANLLGPGSITSVEYAGRLWNLIYVFFTGHLTLLYAALSKKISEGNINYDQLHKSAFKVGLTALAATFVLILFAGPLIKLLYGFGAMASENVTHLASLLKYYFLGTAPFIGGLVYVRALGAEGKTKILAKIALFSVSSNTILNTIFLPLLGLYGIGLATSLTYTLIAVYLFRQYK